MIFKFKFKKADNNMTETRQNKQKYSQIKKKKN